MFAMQVLTVLVVALTDQMQILISGLTVAEQNVTLRTQTGMRGGDSGIFDKKKLYPKELKDSTSVRS